MIKPPAPTVGLLIDAIVSELEASWLVDERAPDTEVRHLAENLVRAFVRAASKQGQPEHVSDAYDGVCPSCGHSFSLAELRRMAVGDGWQRWIMTHLPDGRVLPVRFDEFDPQTMTHHVREMAPP